MDTKEEALAAEHAKWLENLAHVHNYPSSMIELGAYLCTRPPNHIEGFALMLIAKGIAASEAEGAMPLTYSHYGKIANAYVKHIFRAGNNDTEAARLATLYARKAYEMAMAHTPPLDEETLSAYKMVLESVEKLG